MKKVNSCPLPDLRSLVLQATLYLVLALCASCTGFRQLAIPARPANALSGSEFYRQAVSYDWQQRDALAVKEMLRGNMPPFLKKFVAIPVTAASPSGKTIKATIYVSPDYLSVGHRKDWARVPLTPMAAQQVADSLHCFLPTRKIIDDIYRHASVKLAPQPLTAHRDSTPTFYAHHLLVEAQRQGRKGLIAGHKKDVVISSKVSRDPRPNRVAIYGWHLPSGKPIQPLYTGHINLYVDYSHGIRLVYRKIRVGRKWMDYSEVLRDPELRGLLCDEDACDFLRYGY
ncbi:hypothetical protein H9Q13_04195 [Pontibacter sp. JH31]|uniref:Lipoprotein n=1 Tax=Pontibacter aquaedesilientis TaxID=2766980 RepID=A0ABR7XDI3_9BACT|nr:hypothetical protein [Pontibacter aquaedesilientis]MBD1396354.1 hypothetical protein [Pontibacter aquaedesilientis]